MRNLSRYAVITVIAGLALAGCGDETGAGGGPASTTPPSAPTLPTATPSAPTGTPPGTPTGTPADTPGTALPLRVSRTGGFAGFDDQVVIGADGVATVSSRGKDTIRCRLDPSVLTALTTAAQQVDWSSVIVTKPTAKHPDDLILAISSNGRTARLEDPKVKPMVAPVNTLLTQATNPPGKLCKQI